MNMKLLCILLIFFIVCCFCNQSSMEHFDTLYGSRCSTITFDEMNENSTFITGHFNGFPFKGNFFENKNNKLNIRNFNFNFVKITNCCRFMTRYMSYTLYGIGEVMNGKMIFKTSTMITSPPPPYPMKCMPNYCVLNTVNDEFYLKPKKRCSEINSKISESKYYSSDSVYLKDSYMITSWYGTEWFCDEEILRIYPFNERENSVLLINTVTTGSFLADLRSHFQKKGELLPGRFLAFGWISMSQLKGNFTQYISCPYATVSDELIAGSNCTLVFEFEILYDIPVRFKYKTSGTETNLYKYKLNGKKYWSDRDGQYKIVTTTKPLHPEIINDNICNDYFCHDTYHSCRTIGEFVFNCHYDFEFSDHWTQK